ncbi:hypothetical protein [uncultured Campylobacter sp.]|nr:hypothetical protein [uncultured Campylobacter sp.]
MLQQNFVVEGFCAAIKYKFIVRCRIPQISAIKFKRIKFRVS